MTSYRRSIVRGSLALFGVALGLIGFAGVASAQDASDATIGDGLFLERPAPSPDPGTQLGSEPAAAPAKWSREYWMWRIVRPRWSKSSVWGCFR